MDGLLFKLVVTDVVLGWLEAVALWTDAVAEVKKLNFNYYGIIGANVIRSHSSLASHTAPSPLDWGQNQLIVTNSVD